MHTCANTHIPLHIAQANGLSVFELFSCLSTQYGGAITLASPARNTNPGN